MRKRYSLCLLSLSLFFAVSAQTDPHLKSGSIYSMSCANVTMEIDSAVGGRISSLKVYDPIKGSTYEIFNQASDVNQFGSTFWPSPQKPWNWPPLATIDNQPYSVKIEGNTITLRSAVEPTYNLRFYKKIHFNPADTSVVITYCIKNESMSPQSWAPWEISRVEAKGLTIFKKGNGDITGPLFTNVSGRIKEMNGYWWYNQDLSSNQVTTSGGEKLMCDGLGWLAHITSLKNRILIKRFENIPLSSAAPGESEVQVYTAQNNTYTELENQGAYVTIPGKDSIFWTVRWYARVLPIKSYNVVPGNVQLQSFIDQVIARGDSYAGIKNQTAQAINVYPNPASDYLTIQTNLNSYNKVELQVFDLQGKLALKQSLRDPQQQVSVKGLSAGSYLYQIKSGASSIAKGKFLINR